VAAVLYTFTHKPYTEYRERNIHNNQKKKIGKCWPYPVFASYTLAFALQLRKMHGKTSFRVVENCPDVPVSVVQYIFTHKQYTEQHNETEYTERDICRNGKNGIHKHMKVTSTVTNRFCEVLYSKTKTFWA
jgi:hypothetical protein